MPSQPHYKGFRLHGAFRPFAETLLYSGFFGKSVIGTMTTTLLFAYSDSYMAMLMLFMVKVVPPENFMNLQFLSSAILTVLFGSLGLITVSQFTVFVGGFFFHLSATAYQS